MIGYDGFFPQNESLMTPLLWIVVFTALGGTLSVLAASGILLFPERLRSRLVPALVSFATGALLAAALLAILPHAIESPGIHGAHTITTTVLAGLLGFFLLEKFVLFRHCHSHECDAHTPHAPHGHAAGHLILIGDAFHNFVDGVLIAAAFLTDFHLGVVTALAVAAHELPQELGDFAVLLASGFTRRRALVYNILASLTTVLGGVLAYFALSEAMAAVPYVLAIAAAGLLYIAVADLIPGLHKRLEFAATVEQLLLIAAGIGVIYFAHSTLH